jgi:putative transposase
MPTMGQTLSRILLHVVFSTKDREPLIPGDAADRLYAYFGSVADSEHCTLLAAGGVEDHVHLLVVAKPVVAPADFVRVLKSNSSRWLKETFPKCGHFAWQNGYGVFSIGESGVPAVRKYIAGQREHHREVTFQDEFRSLCRKYGIEWDERYVWQ